MAWSPIWILKEVEKPFKNNSTQSISIFFKPKKLVIVVKRFNHNTVEFLIQKRLLRVSFFNVSIL